MCLLGLEDKHTIRIHFPKKLPTSLNLFRIVTNPVSTIPICACPSINKKKVLWI